MYNSLQLLLENDTPWTLKPAGKDWPPRTRDCSAHVFAGAPSPWSTSPCPHWSGAPPCTARHWSVSGSCGMSGHLHPKLPCKNSRASDLTLSCVPQTSHFPVPPKVPPCAHSHPALASGKPEDLWWHRHVLRLSQHKNAVKFPDTRM